MSESDNVKSDASVAHETKDSPRVISRRAALGTTASVVSGVVFGGGVANAVAGETEPVVAPDATRVPGQPSSSLSTRSSFEQPSLMPTGVTTGPSFTPLQYISGTITPSDLHFQRHHNGIALIDPAAYELLVHGMVDRAMVFNLDELKRFPAVTRVYSIECSGNGRAAYRAPKPDMTPQVVDGLTSNSEWTGVPVAALLREAGLHSNAKWVLAEGGDAAVLSRSIPLGKLLEDALVAYAQNGEPLRTANGYPARLLLPGYEGNMSIKWLRRLEVIAEPNMSRDETSKYTDPLPDGTARQFSFVIDAKSIITSPAFPERLTVRGWIPIRGLAWSGRGKIAQVDVSTDGGRTWTMAQLAEPVLSLAHTRFEHMWHWDGSPATLMSRAIDDTGYVQPTLETFRAGRGAGTDFHFNPIRSWRVEADGSVFFAG